MFPREAPDIVILMAPGVNRSPLRQCLGYPTNTTRIGRSSRAHRPDALHNRCVTRAPLDGAAAINEAVAASQHLEYGTTPQCDMHTRSLSSAAAASAARRPIGWRGELGTGSWPSSNFPSVTI